MVGSANFISEKVEFLNTLMIMLIWAPVVLAQVAKK